MKKITILSCLIAMLTIMGVILCTETNHTKMMQSLALHGHAIMGLKNATDKTLQENWLQDLKNVRAYVKKTEPRTLSASNRKLFASALTALVDASYGLFNTAQLVYKMRKPETTQLASYQNILASHLKTVSALQKKMTIIFSDYKSTKEIKRTLNTILTALEGILEKALKDLTSLQESAEFFQDKKLYGEGRGEREVLGRFKKR